LLKAKRASFILYLVLHNTRNTLRNDQQLYLSPDDCKLKARSTSINISGDNLFDRWRGFSHLGTFEFAQHTYIFNTKNNSFDKLKLPCVQSPYEGFDYELSSVVFPSHLQMEYSKTISKFSDRENFFFISRPNDGRFWKTVFYLSNSKFFLIKLLHLCRFCCHFFPVLSGPFNRSGTKLKSLK